MDIRAMSFTYSQPAAANKVKREIGLVSMVVLLLLPVVVVVLLLFCLSVIFFSIGRELLRCKYAT